MAKKTSKRIYMDYAATTYTDERVVKAMMPYFNTIFGNAGSLHEFGRESKDAIFIARKTIATILNCAPEEIYFTGSGTEADNLAIFGVARALKNSGNHIVTTTIEHHAVLYPCEKLEKEGFAVTYLSVDGDGLVSVENLEKVITDQTIFVTIMMANNEVGTIEPIAEIGELIKKIRLERRARQITTPIYFHTDACQSAGYLDIDVQKLGVDLMTINGSKIYGPKGTGALFIRRGTRIEALTLGGGQEGRIRSGTENIAGIIGLAKALEICQQIRKKESARLEKLRDYFIAGIFKKVGKVVLGGHPIKRLPNNVNISILDIEGEAMLLWLDRYGVACSTGSACSSQNLDPSHVILALGRPYEFAHGNLRFSLGRKTTKQEVDYVLSVLPKIVETLRKISPINVEMDATAMTSPEAFAGQGMPHFVKKKNN